MRDFLFKIKMYLWQKKSVVVFFLFALLIVVPLFFRWGFIFLLDWVPVPQTPFPVLRFDPFFLFEFVWWGLNLLLSGGIIQKIFLASIFFLVGFGMFHFLRMNNIGRWGSYFGGILYLFNPFVYSRILTGQWSIIAGYALLPLLLRSFFLSFRSFSLYRAGRTALWWTLIVILNIHAGIFAFILLIVFSVSITLRSNKESYIFLKNCIVIFFSFFVLNIYWIAPAFLGETALGGFAAKIITETHIFSFFTRVDPQHGALWNTAAMYGFWGDEDMRYVPQKMFVSYWFYIFFALFSLVLWGVGVSILKSKILAPKLLRWYGAGASQKSKLVANGTELLDNEILPRQKADQDDGGTRDSSQDDKTALDFFQWWIVVPLILTGLVAFFFAVGVAYEPFKPAVLWFYHHIPFFRGFREPQKFVALLVFVYAIFGAVGVDDLLGRIERIKNKRARIFKLVAPAFFLLIPLAYSPGMLWGFHGQIKPSNYPASWFQVDEFLKNDYDDFRTLFLPWHQYIYLSFAHTVIANPAERFFHKPVIAGDNMEFGPIYTQSTRPESKYIEQEILGNKSKFIAMKGKPPELHLGEKLNHFKIKYIIMAKDSDFFNYTYIANSPDMKLVYDSPELAVYENLLFDENI